MITEIRPDEKIGMSAAHIWKYFLHDGEIVFLEEKK